MATSDNQQQKKGISLVDAYNYIQTACKRCDKLSMDEGVVLNASLAIVKRTIEQRLAQDQLLQGKVPDGKAMEKAAAAAKKKAESAAKNKAAAAAKKKNRKKG